MKRSVSLGVILAGLLMGGVTLGFAQDNEPSSQPRSAPIVPEQVHELLRGRVFWLADVMQGRGIEIDEELANPAMLETAEGRLYSILPEFRGRAFYLDERLHDRPVDLYVRRHDGGQFVQVLLVYGVEADGSRTEIDYYCDICSIQMFEPKACECCQAPNYLRIRPIDELPPFVQEVIDRSNAERGMRRAE